MGNCVAIYISPPPWPPLSLLPPAASPAGLFRGEREGEGEHGLAGKRASDASGGGGMNLSGMGRPRYYAQYTDYSATMFMIYRVFNLRGTALR